MGSGVGMSVGYCHSGFVAFCMSRVSIQKKRPESLNAFLCGRRDSNPHASRHQILSLDCLPISTRPLFQKNFYFRFEIANVVTFFESANKNALFLFFVEFCCHPVLFFKMVFVFKSTSGCLFGEHREVLCIEAAYHKCT